MKDNSPVYWKMRNGRLISVDDMDINHLRNVLKMIIRNNYRVQVVQAKPKVEVKLSFRCKTQAIQFLIIFLKIYKN